MKKLGRKWVVLLLAALTLVIGVPVAVAGPARTDANVTAMTGSGSQAGGYNAPNGGMFGSPVKPPKRPPAYYRFQWGRKYRRPLQQTRRKSDRSHVVL